MTMLLKIAYWMNQGLCINVPMIETGTRKSEKAVEFESEESRKFFVEYSELVKEMGLLKDTEEWKTIESKAAALSAKFRELMTKYKLPFWGNMKQLQERKAGQ